MEGPYALFHRGRWNDKIWDFAAMEKHRHLNGAARSPKWRWIDNKYLYDIENDPGQTNNLATSQPEVMEKLKKQYDARWDTLGPYQVNDGKEQIKKGNFPCRKDTRHESKGRTASLVSQTHLRKYLVC